jgi:uncharacterized membrane protein YccC
MNDRSSKGIAPAEPTPVDVDAATRRLLAALDALESAVERRRDADRDEDELARRIQALGTDRSRLADELDAALVKSRRLERSNREIAERLDTAIGTIRAVLDGTDNGGEHPQESAQEITQVNAQERQEAHQEEHTEEIAEGHEGEAEDILHAGILSEDGDEEEEDEDGEEEEEEE